MIPYFVFPKAPPNLSMKEGSLFCSYEIQRTGMLQIVLLVSWESCRWGRGAWAWFHDVWTCGAKVLEYWMNSSLKIKLYRSWKFWRNWNVPLVLLERSCWVGFMGIYLVRFGFRMWKRYWFLSDFYRWKFKFIQKTRFWKEKLVEDVVTIGPMAQATLVNMK
jgi:hypothetical protein